MHWKAWLDILGSILQVAILYWLVRLSLRYLQGVSQSLKDIAYELKVYNRNQNKTIESDDPNRD